MDWEEPKRQSSKSAAIGDNLETLSIAELEQRISAFTGEIERVKTELTKKRAHETAAAAFFKKPGE